MATSVLRRLVTQVRLHGPGFWGAAIASLSSLRKLPTSMATELNKTFYRLARLVATGLLLATAGCADLGYYLQSVQGHLGVVRAARPVADWQADEASPQELKDRLALAQRIRRFAVTELALPDNASYTRYADLQRRAVVWNVVAAPPLSLTLKTWCFAVVGCVVYRGYYEEASARALAEQLKSEGQEVYVYGVPAYSTLGWLNWLGGDPLLNTFIHYPEAELARLIFHELAHQVAYAKDDTTFNESFATAVERLGGARWLAANAEPQAREGFDQNTQRRAEFRNLVLNLRKNLEAVYQDPKIGNAQKQTDKTQALQNFRNNYQNLRGQWLGRAELTAKTAGTQPETQSQFTTQFNHQVGRYDQWVANVNNASLGAQAAYDDWVPALEVLFKNQQASKTPWPAFYDAVRKLAELPKSDRKTALERIASTAGKTAKAGD